MNENDNIFDISDYSGYFDSSATEVVDIPVEGSEPDSDIELPATDAPPLETDETILPSDSDIGTDTEIITETPVIVEEPKQSFTAGTVDYTKQFEDVNAHLKNIESISIVVLVAVGILIGINTLKILLDRLWR